MIKTDGDILYNRLKNTVGFDKSKKHLAFVGGKYPGKVLHHLFGSFMGKKTSDYAVIPLTIEEHERAEADKSNYAIEHLHTLIKILIERVKELEQTTMKGNKQ